VISITIIFGILEAGVRFSKYRGANLYQEDKDPYIARRYKANLDVMHKGEAGDMVHTKTNKYGFIGEDWEKAKGEDVIRIANLGDSMTAGIDVDFDKTYSHLIGELLGASLGLSVEGLNFGIAGQSTGHALATYRHYARDFDPDIVILWVFLGNDFEENLLYEEGDEDGFDEKASVFKKIARKSELAHLIVNRAARIPIFASLMDGTILTRVGNDQLGSPIGLPISIRLIYTDDEENERAIAMTRKYIMLLKESVLNDNKKLLVMMIPESFQVEKKLEDGLFEQYPQLTNVNFGNRRPNQALVEILDELLIDYIDLTPKFQIICDEDPPGICTPYTRPHGHLSQEGHRFASETAVEFLKENFIDQKLIADN